MIGFPSLALSPKVKRAIAVAIVLAVCDLLFLATVPRRSPPRPRPPAELLQLDAIEGERAGWASAAGPKE